MANNSEDFLCNLPKRFKMSFDDSECNSNLDATLNPTTCNSSVEERTLIGNFIQICLVLASLLFPIWRIQRWAQIFRGRGSLFFTVTWPVICHLITGLGWYRSLSINSWTYLFCTPINFLLIFISFSGGVNIFKVMTKFIRLVNYINCIRSSTFLNRQFFVPGGDTALSVGSEEEWVLYCCI